MKIDTQKQLLESGYKIRVQLKPNPSYTKVVLKTFFINEGKQFNEVYNCYYNHCKQFLNKDQLYFIDTYNEVKNYRFNQIVDLNIKKNKDLLSEDDEAKLLMLRAIKNKEYIYQD